MKDLETVWRKIDRLEGGVLAVESLVLALCEVLPPATVPVVQAFFESEIEAVRHQLHNFSASRSTVEAFENDTRRLSARLAKLGGRDAL